MLRETYRRVWTWLGHVSTVAWLWSLGGGFVIAFLGSLSGDLAPWQLICLGVGTFFLVLAALGTWVRPVWEIQGTATSATGTPGDSHIESENETTYVDLVGRMAAIDGLGRKYPQLLGITPPSVTSALAEYIETWYRERRLARPEVGPDGTAYDNETLILFEDEFEDAIQAVRDYLAYRGLALDIEVNDLRGIRPLVRRLEESSDFEKWPNFP